ncbi:MAG: hypothetical protein DMG72_24475 [Acidobacteria bacterium]|nr:MAG: hypothetical protein DMG72_24475 [Acidobacteriota bacterium]
MWFLAKRGAFLGQLALNFVPGGREISAKALRNLLVLHCLQGLPNGSKTLKLDFWTQEGIIKNRNGQEKSF